MSATEEHQRLSNVIKQTHEALRESSRILGTEKAWEEHLKDENTLKKYAEAMQQLAEVWEENAGKVNTTAKSRISWIFNYCLAYFITEKIIVEKRRKEMVTLEMDTSCKEENWQKTVSEREMESFKEMQTIKLLDVGSCFNPFEKMDLFDVTAVDISPAKQSVYKCDFLKVNISEDFQYSSEDSREIKTLPYGHFDCVVFSLLLEYIPSSPQRIDCCRKAYDLLKYEGILIIITPDSQHVGKNAKIMKNWRYTLAVLGFTRIKFEKLPHITCLVFRKSLNKSITECWAELHKESYMTFTMNTPQDHEKQNDN